ncbi:unnamed protein product, partial [Protopolystoma xenopodis]
MIIIGSDCLQRVDGAALHKLARRIAARFISGGIRTFNVLHRVASQVAALDLGYKPGVDQIQSKKPAILFLLGADQGAISRADLPDGCFVVYIGHNGDVGASMADIVLPGAAYTEKAGIYANTEGRAQQTQPAIMPPGASREDWRILRAISEVAAQGGRMLPYETREQLHNRIRTIAPGLLVLNKPVAPAIETLALADKQAIS